VKEPMFGKKKPAQLLNTIIPHQNKAVEGLKKGSVGITDIIAPSSVEVDFKHIRVDDKYYRTFFVVDYPRFASPGWLSSLIDFKQTMNISMFLYPVEGADILQNLRRKIAEMEATLESDAEAGLDTDPKIAAALEDALGLQEELAKGLERFFQFGLYITLSADTLAELEEKSKQIKNLAASNLLILKPATLQMEEGFKTTLPTGVDSLYITRNMDTTSLATTFPFSSYELSQSNGVLYGVNTLNSSLVILDRFSFENANEVVFGKSGSGKSFLLKLEVLRQLMFDAEVLIIDPEEEYRTLTESLGGEYITFSKNSPVKLNPFSLNPDDKSESQLGVKILTLHGLLKTMLGEMSPTQEAIIDRAIVASYKLKGISPDPATYTKEPPIIEDLYKILLNMEEEDAKELAFRVEKYVKGGFADLFNQQTNYDLSNQMTVFSLKQVEDSIRPIAMHVILDFVWSKIRTKLKKRILIVDEAWYLVKHPDSASFLQGIAKRARKYYLGLTTATQDIEDFLGNDYGRTILSNSSIQILMKQSSTGIETLSKALLLSEGEKQFILNAEVGSGLMFAGQNHISTHFIASDYEYNLITSKPQDILDQKAPSVPLQPKTPIPEASQENEEKPHLNTSGFTPPIPGNPATGQQDGLQSPSSSTPQSPTPVEDPQSLYEKMIQEHTDAQKKS
jgi:conjugal transfer ATP-binding protein TraC